MIKNLILCIFGLCIFSCDADTKSTTSSTSSKENTTVQKDTPTPNKYGLTPFTPSPSFDDAKISDMKYVGRKFSFKVEGKDYQLGAQTPDAPQKMCANSAKGQHIHLIINNEPYMAKYTSSFEADIPDGEHYALAFLSRSYHESIKTNMANITKKIDVKGGKITKAEDVDLPMLFYSRPKGTYVGKNDTEKVMLDFYLKNADLGANYKVRADINGEIHMLDKWQPYYITGLPMGENTIELTLVDKKNHKIETPLNPVKRTFTLKADPAE